VALDSTSTFTEALAQYNNSLLWPGDSTKTANMFAAVGWLIGNRAQYSMESGSQLNFEKLQNLYDVLLPIVVESSNSETNRIIHGRTGYRVN